jgi:hypothetical protein
LLDIIRFTPFIRTSEADIPDFKISFEHRLKSRPSLCFIKLACNFSLNTLSDIPVITTITICHCKSVDESAVVLCMSPSSTAACESRRCHIPIVIDVGFVAKEVALKDAFSRAYRVPAVCQHPSSILVHHYHRHLGLLKYTI